jgi:hypothetical protein
VVELEASAPAATPVGGLGAPADSAVEAADATEVPTAVAAVAVKV